MAVQPGCIKGPICTSGVGPVMSPDDSAFDQIQKVLYVAVQEGPEEAAFLLLYPSRVVSIDDSSYNLVLYIHPLQDELIEKDLCSMWRYIIQGRIGSSRVRSPGVPIDDSALRPLMPSLSSLFVCEPAVLRWVTTGQLTKV